MAHFNYTLWAEKAEGSNNIFSGSKKKRSDRKQVGKHPHPPIHSTPVYLYA